MHPAYPLKVIQIFQGNNHLPEVHPSFLWFTAPPGQVNEGKMLQCLCFSQDHMHTGSALCACSVSRAQDFAPSCLISSYLISSCLIPSHPIPIAHCCTAIHQERELSYFVPHQIMFSECKENNLLS